MKIPRQQRVRSEMRMMIGPCLLDYASTTLWWMREASPGNLPVKTGYTSRGCELWCEISLGMSSTSQSASPVSQRYQIGLLAVKSVIASVRMYHQLEFHIVQR